MKKEQEQNVLASKKAYGGTGGMGNFCCYPSAFLTCAESLSLISVPM